MTKRLICWLFGHADIVVRWGPWQDDPDMGRHRVITEECPRCGGVLALRSQVDGEPWTP